MTAAPAYPPILLPEPEAARYLGVSQTTLRTLGLQRKVLGRRRLYYRLDLEAFAADLPLDGESENTFDAAFGTAPHPDGQERR